MRLLAVVQSLSREDKRISRLGIRLAAQTAHQVYYRQNERNAQDSKHHERFGILEVVSPIREEMVVRDKEVQTRAEE